jgi:transposase
MAYFLGCDVSKRKLDLCLEDGHGRQVWADQVANDEPDIAAFLLSVTGNYSDITLVVEATGCFHLPFAETAYALGLISLVYKPLITKQQIKATVRGKKTDKTDALMIARLGMRGEGRPYAPELYLTTKYYARGMQRLGQFSGALTLYERHIEQLLGDELSPDIVATLGNVRSAFNLARKSISREMTASSPEELSKRLQTIPGVGPIVAASVIGEIQDMKRFRSSKQLIAYAGLDPKIKQSGHTLNSTGRLTKRGSSYLRHIVFIAASAARQHDPSFKALYDKKRAEGKSYTVAVCVVTRKMLGVIRSVWVNETNYTAEAWSD